MELEINKPQVSDPVNLKPTPLKEEIFPSGYFLLQ